MRPCPVPPLDLSQARAISPGACPSAGDYEMHSPTLSWCGSLVLPERPRTSQSRRPSWDYSNRPDTLPPEAWRILPGMFVAFQLDMIPIANHYTPTSREAQAMLRFNGGRYLGLVVESMLKPKEDGGEGRDEVLVVYFVSNQPPPGEHAKKHVIPILPFDNLDRYYRKGDGGAADDDDGKLDRKERPPIETKALFPFPNRLQWTSYGTRISVERFVDSKLGFKMDEDEYNHVEDLILADAATLLTVPDPDTVLQKMQVPSEPLPATVWRDIRGGHNDDPAEFVNEVYDLIEEIRGYAEENSSVVPDGNSEEDQAMDED